VFLYLCIIPLDVASYHGVVVGCSFLRCCGTLVLVCKIKEDRSIFFNGLSRWADRCGSCTVQSVDWKREVSVVSKKFNWDFSVSRTRNLSDLTLQIWIHRVLKWTWKCWSLELSEICISETWGKCVAVNVHWDFLKWNECPVSALHVTEVAIGWK
jgi:hypothetical protein